MKVRILRAFTYQVSPTATVTLPPGVHDLPKDIAEKVLRWGKAKLVVEKPVLKKKAPENKVAKVPDNKTTVGKSAMRRRGAGAKSKR